MPLVHMQDMLRHARAEGYAVGAYDAVDSTFVSAIIAGAEAAQAPVIVSFAESHFAHYDFPVLMAAAEAAARRANVPVALFLDHGSGHDSAVAAIRHGCNGVMVDASHQAFADNVAATRKVVDMAHALGVPVEGELGYVPGVEGADAVLHPGEMELTSPAEAARYVAESGIDFLAVSVGTVHGRLRGEPRLDLDRLAAIGDAVGVPLVIHGGTGLADEQFAQLTERGVAKINYYTALADLASAAAAHALGPTTAGYTAALDAAHAAIAQEVERTSRVFGAAGRATAVQDVCRPWREVEHVVLYNWDASAAEHADEYERQGRKALAAVPGVRAVVSGVALREDSRYRRCWLIRLVSAKAEASYMADARHREYADDVFRPHAPDRLKTDYRLD